MPGFSLSQLTASDLMLQYGLKITGAPRETTMPATQFNRDYLAHWYANSHLDSDPGIIAVHYLPTDAEAREIRLLEVNELLADWIDDSLEIIDFGVDRGTENAHTLMIMDVRPEQFERILSKDLQLPGNWTLDGAIPFKKR